MPRSPGGQRMRRAADALPRPIGMRRIWPQTATIGRHPQPGRSLLTMFARANERFLIVRSRVRPRWTTRWSWQGGEWYLNGIAYANDDGSPAAVADSRWLYEFCGFQAPPGLIEAVGTEFGTSISEELLPSIDADHIFVIFRGLLARGAQRRRGVPRRHHRERHLERDSRRPERQRLRHAILLGAQLRHGSVCHRFGQRRVLCQLAPAVHV